MVYDLQSKCQRNVNMYLYYALILFEITPSVFYLMQLHLERPPVEQVDFAKKIRSIQGDNI